MKSTNYSITDLERLTGVKAPTIRMWEKRYGIISPERTDSNIRYYSAGDLQRLLNIVFLNRHGFKISAISAMSDEAIAEAVFQLTEKPEGDEGWLPSMIQAISDLDEDGFERLLNASILKSGFEKSFTSLVFPLLDKIRLLWQINKMSACQERFVKNLVRHKLVVAIDGLAGHHNPNPNHYLLFLPNGQYDETFLLYANYLLRKNGHHVLYLGPSIPLDHLRSVRNSHDMDAIVVHANGGFSHKELLQYIDHLLNLFPNQKIMMMMAESAGESPNHEGRLKVIPVGAISGSLLAV